MKAESSPNLFLARVAPVWRWLVWTLYVLSWSAALLVPPVIDPGDDQVLRLGLKLFSKFVHVCAYAVLALLTLWLPLRKTYRWLMAGLLIPHALATEFLQYVMALGRTGSWRDFALNLAGIAVGIYVAWRWGPQWAERSAGCEPDPIV